MRTWRIFSLAALALVLTLPAPARADENNKLTYLTFSAPVDLPGISLPAGRYRFELADPVESRKAIRISSDDQKKVYGTLLTIPNKMAEPVKDPVVMFKESASGMPHAVKAWFYPGESIGYEFVYPKDQAVKIAKAAHEPVATQQNGQFGHVNESGQFSSENTSSATTAQNNQSFANSGAVTTVDRSNTASTAGTTAAATTTAGTTAQRSTGTSGQASSTTANRATTGTTAQRSSTAGNRQLPRTASDLPWLAVFSVLSTIGALGVRQLRLTR